jgi:glycosyltransferase involved in cell wall biosynthesis
VLRRLSEPQAFLPEVVFIDEPRLAGLLDLFPEARIVYRATDLYADIRHDTSIWQTERYLIKRAHRFIATSQPVASHLAQLGANDILVMENGVDLDHFRPRTADSTQGHSIDDRRIAVYVGAIDQRFGFDCITVAATENPDVTFWLLGPITELAVQRLRHLRNVKMHGTVKFEDLPGYLRKASVALLPLSDDPANAGRSPMKLFEYAAVGLPVIATATPELSRRELRFVSLASNPTEFALRVKDWFSGSLHLEGGMAEASKHGWVSKSAQALAHALS